MFAAMTLKNRLLVMQGISLAMFVAMAIFSVIVLHGAVRDEEEDVSSLSLEIEVMRDIDILNIAVLKEAKLAKDVWLRGADAEKLKKLRGEFAAEQNRFEERERQAAADVAKLAEGHQQEFAPFIAGLESSLSLHRDISGKYLAQIDAHRGDPVESDARVAGIDRELTKQITELREKFVGFTLAQAQEKLALAESGYSQRRTIIVVWVLVSLALTVLFAALIVRQVLRQLGGDPSEVAAIVRGVAEGDLHRQIELAEGDEGSVLAGVKSMQGQLARTISQIHGHAEQLAASAEHLSTASSQVAASSDEQSKASSSMAAAVEQNAASEASVTETAAEIFSVAQDASSRSEQGVRSLSALESSLISTGAAMSEIEAAVKDFIVRAGDIDVLTQQVRAIAEQTNLLALNAAIEAARAGEQGRGFAVVADEVRKLAEKSAHSTGEIDAVTQSLKKQSQLVETTIGKGVDSIQSSKVLMGEVSDVLQGVAGAVQRTTSGMSDIDAVVRKQAAAGASFARNVELISSMVEQNNAAVRHVSSSANELLDLSAKLRTSVAYFRVA